MQQKYTRGFRKFLTPVKKPTSDMDIEVQYTPTFKKQIFANNADLVTDASLTKHSPFKVICLNDDNGCDDARSQHS